MTLLVLLVIILIGCQTKIVKHPDAPMLIEDMKWGKASVAIYDKETNSLIHYGWVDVPVGWTLHKYDWESFIKGQ